MFKKRFKVVFFQVLVPKNYQSAYILEDKYCGFYCRESPRKQCLTATRSVQGRKCRSVPLHGWICMMDVLVVPDISHFFEAIVFVIH